VADLTRPSVVGTNPADTITGVDINAQITVVFSERMDLASVTSQENYLVTTAGGSISLDPTVPITAAVRTRSRCSLVTDSCRERNQDPRKKVPAKAGDRTKNPRIKLRPFIRDLTKD
jgi:hypothetical protein